jgi:MFS family permease
LPLEGTKVTNDLTKPFELFVPFRGSYAWYVLGLLGIVNLLNYLDRTLIYILFTPIKQEMAFSDFELGLLGTTSFVILFAALGIPFGRLADRRSRKNMIAGGLAVWSLFSGLTGFANGFWSLFLCRVMVGVGEATLVAGIPGTLLGGFLSDRMRRYGPGGRMRLGWVASLFAIPFWIVLLFSFNVPLLLLANFILLGLSLIWLAPAMADIHDITGPHLRGLGVGVFICIVHVAAYGVGSPLIGKLSDLFGAATTPGVMRYSLLISPISCLLAAILLRRGSHFLEKTHESS